MSLLVFLDFCFRFKFCRAFGAGKAEKGGALLRPMSRQEDAASESGAAVGAKKGLVARMLMVDVRNQLVLGGELGLTNAATVGEFVLDQAFFRTSFRSFDVPF